MTATADHTSALWWPCTPPDNAAVRLYALPYAGAGTLAYEGWRCSLPAHVACVPARLPGRESRMSEPALTDLHSAAQQATAALLPRLQPPYVLYGHSMGALLALHVLRDLERRNVEPPIGLVVAARPAPHLQSSRPGTERIPDDRIVDELLRLGALPEQIAKNPAAVALFLPLLRADLALNEVREDPPQPVDVPILALAGARDPRVKPSDVAAWRLHTTAGFRFDVLPGGHFFAFTDVAATANVIVEQIDAWTRGAR